MDYVHLGRSGLRVSPLCLGTMNFGSRTTEEDAHRIMDHALELGINFFDTANAYGRTVHWGLTEEILGSWFAKGGGRRDGDTARSSAPRIHWRSSGGRSNWE